MISPNQEKQVKNSLKYTFSLRTFELILIDTAIIACVWLLMNFLSGLAIGSMEINDDFSVKKIFALYLCIMASRMVFRRYHTILRYADSGAFLLQILADITGGIVFFLLGRYLIRGIYVGFAYTLITTTLIVVVTIISRMVYQQLYKYYSMAGDEHKSLPSLLFKGGSIHKINIAIIGAGNVGTSLASDFIRNPESHYYPLMFVDTDARKIGATVNGIRVYPEDDDIVGVINSLPVQEIVIAIPDAKEEDITRLYNLYSQTGCKIKIYDYPLSDNSDSKINKKGKLSLREFSIEDLLFRKTLDVKSDKVTGFYKSKTVLVTGGGGSIGSELCRHIAGLEPKKLIILDIYENNAYDIQQELIRKYGLYNAETGEGLDIEAVIASVRDEKRIDEIFAEYRPEVVFHAAAHKHVPLMENSGCEAIKNNVFGTYNVANAAEKYGVENFLLISTDKAVNPTNIMGASKTLCEMVIQCRQDSATKFCAVRFGNVLGSNGSVIPLFKKQIENGGPITLTDKRIIRYFMTIPEAVGLVMETCVMAKAGDLYVLDMGKPVKILELAEDMIRLAGYKPYEDIDIVEIGLRPGEKLYEELLIKSESLSKTDNDLIFIEHMSPYTREEIEGKLQILADAIEDEESGSNRGYREAVVEAIKQTVRSYQPPEIVNEKAAKEEQ